MSVSHFDSEELGNLAACAVGGSLASDDGKRRLQRYCEGLALFSIANTQAYRATYPNDTEPAQHYTAEEIYRASRRTAHGPDHKRASLTAVLLHYNMIANDGRDFATTEVLGCVCSILARFIR